MQNSNQKFTNDIIEGNDLEKERVGRRKNLLLFELYIKIFKSSAT